MNTVALAQSATVLGAFAPFGGLSDASTAPRLSTYYGIRQNRHGNRQHAEKPRMQELSRIYSKQLNSAVSRIETRCL